MNRIIRLLLLLLALHNTGLAQTPVPMASQPGLTYTENFADIANWTNNFASGIGANRFASVAVNAAGSIPNGLTTTSSTATFVTGSAEGVQLGSASGNPAGTIVMLATNTTSNTHAIAIDFFLDFTGVNAGTLSFDWAEVNNSTGNRGASLKVYSSTDGITFTEIAAAAVNNIINNVSSSGSITTVALPASFNNTATARLRFYYFNGTTTGTSGSRPKISIDNLTVTAVANNPCSTPTAQPTSMVFGTITSSSIAGSFTAASPAADEYLTVASLNPALTSNPVDGNIYNPGDALGDGFVVARDATLNFSATGLSAATTYYFFSFSLNSVCIGGPKYLTTNPLTNNATTISANPPCSAPAAQAINLNLGPAGINNIPGSFTVTAADEYLVLVSASNTLTNTPANGTVYNAGDILGNATVAQRSNANSFNASGLNPGTLYYIFIFSLNSLNCTGGPVYNITAPLSGSLTTLSLPACSVPPLQPSNLSLNASNTAIAGNFVAAPGADDYLIISSLSATLGATPVSGTDYTVGSAFGSGTVIANSASNSFNTTGLTPGTTYYFFIFAANKNCSGGTKYLTASPLTGNKTTTNSSGYNYYFGTLHSHSAYSDGNKDNLSYTPADDYNYAITSLCMDFLGISEHNHYSSPSNPGNKLSTYHTGISQATTFTAAHANSFVALYGMEWGVISGGGHVVIYGDGMDYLFGWESGSGGWGATNNYDIYVPKSVYKGNTGVFKTVNDYVANNTFATLAHPQQTDFDNLAGTAYDAVSDDAITGVAVESGPATSTNTTYSNPGSSMSYLSYFQGLLAKGYHLGPNIDHDNHYTTFGHTTYSRTAVIAPSLTKTEIIKAMRNMHFYATQDCDTKVDYTVNTNIMGSIVTDRYAPTISVTLSDATTSTASAVIKIMSGTPGSGSVATQIYSATGSSLSYSDNNLANNSTAYYYIDITNGSSRIITAPVWYTRNDNVVLAVKLGTFQVKKSNRAVQLNWSTEQESNSSHFIIERSADGRTWTSIGTLRAAGNSSGHIDYLYYDNAPLGGTGYYRIRLVDLSGNADFSPVRSIYFDSPFNVTISPNPARDLIHISLSKNNGSSSVIQVIDVSGNKMYEEKTNSSAINVNVSGFSKGIYFVKVIDDSGVVTGKVLVD